MFVLTSTSASVNSEPIQSIDSDTDSDEMMYFLRNLSLRWNPRNVKIRYDMTVKNAGNATVSITTFLAKPSTHINQELFGEPIYSPDPDGFSTDRWGQTVAYFIYTLEPNESINLTWEANAKVYTVRYILLPWKVKGDIPQNILENYTADDTKYKINDPYIKNIVQDVVGGINNILIKAIKLHDYVIDNLEYSHDGKWDDAVTALKRGNGSCSEYCFAYIALCRAAGIPARYNGGSVYKKEPPHIDTMYHRIVEIYLPSYGWVPMDVTWNDAWLRHFYFGLHINKLFTLTVGGGSSGYLNWSYHFWQNVSPPSDDILVNKSITWLQWERPEITSFKRKFILY